MSAPGLREVDFAVGPQGLAGTLRLPETPLGLVIFAHGSGSSRLSPRNVRVARQLSASGFATLLFDLLTETESADRQNVFDISLLARRMCEAIDWASRDLHFKSDVPMGLFGASTGAAAALVAACARPEYVKAVVSRGGRPDLAGDELAQVQAPTLLIVGGDDNEVLELNRRALRQLRCEAQLAIVPRATHLFEEPGALEQVVALARDWFAIHLSAGAA